MEKVNIFERTMTLISRVTLTAEEQNEENIKAITIGQFVDPEWQYRYNGTIQNIRDLCPDLETKQRNKEHVAALKRSLPAGIVSGIAVGGIGEQNIAERNGVIAFDVDGKDNPQVYDWETLKWEISKSPFVAYIGLSSSGLGIWGLIPIADGMKHKEHFDAIVDDFANTTFVIKQCSDIESTDIQGIRLDPAPSNVASKRFVSFDPNPYMNTAAQVYIKSKEPIRLWEGNYTSNYTGEQFDIEQFFHQHDIAYTMRERQGGTQYIVECPWSHLHSSSSRADSAVFVYPDGRLGYKCMHAHCEDKHWHQYREFYEPDAYTRFIE